MSRLSSSIISVLFLLSYANCQGLYEIDRDTEFSPSGACVHENARHIHETETSARMGVFQSPGYPKSYPQDVECVYIFNAMPNRRVKLMFRKFAVGEGGGDRCPGDFMDIYLPKGKIGSNMIDEMHVGRFCGTINPNTVVSLGPSIRLVLHTKDDQDNKNDYYQEYWNFEGTYEFIPNSDWEFGQLVPNTLCDYHITPGQIDDAEHGSSRYIVSPTYPGRYPENITCTYNFDANDGNRIELFFEDFNIYFLGAHCPYDAVTLYDVNDYGETDIIARLCGVQQGRIQYSMRRRLRMVFHTRPAPVSEPRGYGFRIRVTFATFVNIESWLQPFQHDEQRYPKVKHIRGTMCDVRVMSAGKHEAIQIYSPGFPGGFSRNKRCLFILDGIESNEELEKVEVTFNEVDLPTNAYIGPGEKYESCHAYRVRILTDRVGTNLTRIRELGNSSIETPLARSSGLSELCGTHTDKKVGDGSLFKWADFSACSWIQCDDSIFAGDKDCGINNINPDGTPENTNAFLALYTQGENPSNDDVVFDMVLCQKVKRKDNLNVISKGTRMYISYVTGNATKYDLITKYHGFNLTIDFPKDFGIEGKPREGGDETECDFMYSLGDSENSHSFTINSPRHPHLYPKGSNCKFKFNLKRDEMLKLDFKKFSVTGNGGTKQCDDVLYIITEFQSGIYKKHRPKNWTETVVPKQFRCENHLNEDHHLNPRERVFFRGSTCLRTRNYCSYTAGTVVVNDEPPQFVSEYGATSVVVFFKANNDNVKGIGFEALASYTNKRPVPYFVNTASATDGSQKRGCDGCGCEWNAQGSVKRHMSGVIHSPLFPTRYKKDVTCEWLINVNEGKKVLLTVVSLTLEGNQVIDDSTEARKSHDQCKESAILVYKNVTGPTDSVICGVVEAGKHHMRDYVSDDNRMRVVFSTGPDVNGLKGFRLVWTEITVRETQDGPCPDSTEFKCIQNKYCIPSDMRCDTVLDKGDDQPDYMNYNCGDQDMSDEAECDGSSHVDCTFVLVFSILFLQLFHHLFGRSDC